MSRNFPFQHFLKPSMEKTPPHEEEQLEFDKLNETSMEQEYDNCQNITNDNLEELTKQMRSLIKGATSQDKFNAFFKNLEVQHLTSSTITFFVPTAFIKTMITEYLISFLEDAIFKTLGESRKIFIKTESSIIEESYNKRDTSLQLPTEKKPSVVRFLNNSLQSETNQKKEQLTTSLLEPSDPKEQKGINLDLIPTKEDLLSKVESKYINHMQPDQSGILIDPNKTFENFIIGPSNNIACATAKAVANNPGKSGKYPSLYFYSDSGLGKTHLLHSVANTISNHYPSLIVCLITARDFMNEMIHSIQNNNISRFRKKYSEKIDVLMIDDIHELKDKQGTQNEFFHIFNELHDKGKQLIFTSDKPPKEIAGIEERIKTRLQWGLVIDIQRPDLETKIAILKKKAYELDLYCTDDVITLIASSIKSSIRELEGSLIKLSAFSDVMKMDIDEDIVREQLNLRSQNKKVTDLDDIAKAVSQHFKIPLADLKSKARSKDITKVRHIAMFLSRKIIKATQQEIGHFYGGRDHTSVIHAVNKINQQVKKDSYLANVILEIQNLL